MYILSSHGYIEDLFLVRPRKKLCMFAVTQPSLIKSTEHKLFFREYLQKNIEELFENFYAFFFVFVRVLQLLLYLMRSR